ncbi:MAG TPA: hypothetical protein VK571_03350 [Gemmatimonadaceae bacterium]|nr:hypothetical protein [Gemmatimonadaceae bacterium]
MKPGYEPKTLGGKLAQLMEECHEVGQAVDKTLRLAFEGEIANEPGLTPTMLVLWALNGGNPELDPATRESNRDWILRELADLELAIVAVKKAIA